MPDRIASPVGAAPGTLAIDPGAKAPGFHCIVYDANQLDEQRPASVADLPDAAVQGVTWIDVVGLGDANVLRALGARYRIHPLALEDIANVHQRPKVESYSDEELFIILRQLDAHTDDGTEQVSFFVRPGLVITFQEQDGDDLDPVRYRLRQGGPRLRDSGADYLAYALIDAIVDAYAPELDAREAALDAIEERLLSTADEDDLRALHQLRRELTFLARAAAPVRDVVAALRRATTPLMREETRIFLRDCHDHAARAVERIDAGREQITHLVDLYLSQVGHRTNDVMRVLTIISTIFIPLSFIAGLYGMNFDTRSPFNMPE
ncbi:MAG: magnesium/cobalt transporter CorA, partial [Acidobacteriota bacterium]